MNTDPAVVGVDPVQMLALLVRGQQLSWWLQQVDVNLGLVDTSGFVSEAVHTLTVDTHTHTHLYTQIAINSISLG